MGGSEMAEGGEMLETRRRSVRIWALEEEKKKKKKKKKMEEGEEEKEQKACATKSNHITGNETLPSASNSNSKAGVLSQSQHSEQAEEKEHARPPTVKQYDRRRVRKRKRLEDVVVTSLAYPSLQEGENRKNESISIRNDQRSISSSLQRMPETRVLEFILDILQRKDAHEIFGQPVDPEEVEGYYNIIKEPMDFGTMRAKLQEGMYTSLEQFEHDVFLISNNAMHFNSSTTVYYRKARGIQELAQRIFHALKTDPENFELEFSLTRRRPGRKPQGEASGPCSKRARFGRVNIGVSPKRNTKTDRLFGLNSDFDNRDSKIPTGSGDGFETERRQTYRPWTSFSSENESIVSSLYDLPKPLIRIIGGDLGYKESLMRFVKDLGPTAQMVANRKLEKYLQVEASNTQSQTPTPLARTPDCQVPAPFLTEAPAYLDGVNNGQMPESLLHDLPGDLNVVKYANKQLDVHGDVCKGENAHTRYGIKIPDGAYKGKMVCTDSRMDIDSTYLRDIVPSSDIMGIYGNRQRENAHFNSINDVKIGSPGEIAANTRGDMDICGSSKGKMICINDNMDHLQGTFRYDSTHQNQNGQIWLGSHSHFSLFGNENMNTPAGNGITNMCDKYKTRDMMAESSQLRNQVQPVQLANALHSRLLELMSRSNKYSETSVLPSQAAKVSVQDTTFLHGLGSLNEVGANSAQAGQSLEWSRPTFQQPICDFPNVQMQLNKDIPFGQGTVLQRASHLVAAQKMAVLHAMTFYERATPESHQTEGSQRQSSTDNKQLDLALQL